MWANVFNYVYVFFVVIISIYGLHAMIITGLYLLHFREKDELPEAPEEWPDVAVQIPLYNELLVAERLLNAVCAFDYPRKHLFIQILDDSTDQTTEKIQLRMEHFRSLGYQIQMLHRTDRTGFKAGALAEGMKYIKAEYVAVFDADFVPPPDFLRKVIAHFCANPRVGMVQTRWGHLNRNTNLLTRTQALFLDGHQIVEQVARSRSGLLLNFNGSGGVWRTRCVEESGGWQWNTLSEDIDLSYRAQMRGWKFVFLPDIVVPAEVPPSLLSFKTQQKRWTFGHIQVFLKLIPQVWACKNLSVIQRISATFHLSANFIQLAALGMFLISVPLAFLHPHQPSSLGMISLASSGPTILFAVSQIVGYRGNLKRAFGHLLYLPLLVLLAIGMSVSNCGAVLGAVFGRKMKWVVTPKFSLDKKNNGWSKTAAAASVQLIIWLEIALSIYCAIALSLSLRHAPELMTLSALGMISFGYVGCSGLVESNRPKKASSVKVEMAQQ